MISFALKTIFLVALISINFAAHADIVQENSNFGANTVTVDTVTGSKWLNLSLTQNQSYDNVLSQLGTTFAGYTIASLDQVAQFATDAGITLNGQVNSGTNSSLDSFMHSWGITGYFNQQNFIYAATSTTSPAYPGSIAAAIFDEWYTGAGGNSPEGWYAITTPNNFNLSSIPYMYGGVALVQAVPESESYVMALVGLGLMGFMIRRRKADKTI